MSITDKKTGTKNNIPHSHLTKTLMTMSIAACRCIDVGEGEINNGVKKMDVSLIFCFYFTIPASMGCTLLHVRIVACRLRSLLSI